MAGQNVIRKEFKVRNNDLFNVVMLDEVGWAKSVKLAKHMKKIWPHCLSLQIMKRFSFHQTEGITCLGGFCRGFSGIISEKTGREENKEKNAKTNDRIGGKQSQLLAVYHHFYPPKKNLLFYIRGFFFFHHKKNWSGTWAAVGVKRLLFSSLLTWRLIGYSLFPFW